MNLDFLNRKRNLICTLAVLFILSFTLRWQYIHKTVFLQPLRADAYRYYAIGHNLATYGLFTSNSPPVESTSEARPPGYCFFLAAIDKLTPSFQTFYQTTLWLQCLLGALTVIFSYFLARFFMPITWALLAAMLVMISPHMIILSAYVLTESLFSFLLVVALVLLCLAFKTEKSWPFILAGVFMGLGIFVRPVLGIFPLICVVLFLFMHNRKDVGFSKIIFPILLFLTLSFIFQGSWNIWEKVSFGNDSVMSDQLKSALLQGTYPRMTYNKLIGMPYREDPNFKTLMDKGYGAIASHIYENFRKAPLRSAWWWLVGKPSLFWSWKVYFSDGVNIYPVGKTWFDKNPVLNIIRTVMLKLHIIFIFLTVFGLCFYIFRFSKKLSGSGQFCYLLNCSLLVYFTLLFTILAPFPRYALPLGPAFFVLAVSGAWMMANWLRPLIPGASIAQTAD